MKWKKARPVSREGLTANSTVNRAQATRLIAQEIAERGEQPPLTRNRVSQRIRYAIKTGRLVERSPGKFRFGVLAAWAMDTWPGKFSGWPVSRTISPGTGRACTDTYRVALGMVASVGGPDAAQVKSENEKLRADNEKLRSERDRLCSEIETLRPYKERHDQTRAKRQAAGRRGGRGNKS